MPPLFAFPFPMPPHPPALAAFPAVDVTEHQDLLLLTVASLLAMWLWLLVRRREEAGFQRPKRPEPLSLDELARSAFQAARSRDMASYRSLFLNGAEARDILGEDAAAYMGARNPIVLQRNLNHLAGELSTDATFVGSVPVTGDRVAMCIRKPGHEDRALLLGSVVQVGHIYRIFGPALSSTGS